MHKFKLTALAMAIGCLSSSGAWAQSSGGESFVTPLQADEMSQIGNDTLTDDELEALIEDIESGAGAPAAGGGVWWGRSRGWLWRLHLSGGGGDFTGRDA